MRHGDNFQSHWIAESWSRWRPGSGDRVAGRHHLLTCAPAVGHSSFLLKPNREPAARQFVATEPLDPFAHCIFRKCCYHTLGASLRQLVIGL